MPFQHFHHKILRSNILADINVLHLTLMGFRKDLLLHHPFAHGSHLRTAVGIDNGGDDVSAKGRTNLIQQILVHGVGLLLLMVTDFQAGTVGGQTAVQGAGNPGSQVAANHRCPHQGYLRFLLLKEFDQNRCVRQGGIGFQDIAFGNVHDIHTKRKQLLLHSLQTGADHHCFQLALELVGQFTGLGTQFQTDISNHSLLGLAINEYIVHSDCFCVI